MAENLGVQSGYTPCLCTRLCHITVWLLRAIGFFRHVDHGALAKTQKLHLPIQQHCRHMFRLFWHFLAADNVLRKPSKVFLSRLSNTQGCFIRWWCLSNNPTKRRQNSSSGKVLRFWFQNVTNEGIASRKHVISARSTAGGLPDLTFNLL